MKQHDAPEGFGREGLRAGYLPMQQPSVPTGGGATDRPAAPHQIKIGRLVIDIATTDQYPANDQARLNSLEPSYALVLPQSKPLNFRQGCSGGIALPGEYALLSQPGFDALLSQSRLDLVTVHIPASELRSRLACVDDHLGRRFSANASITRLLVDLIRGVTEMFVDSAPPNPEALATGILSFVALTIGAEDRGAVPDVRNARYYLRRRIFDYIEIHLGEHDLSPRKIAATSRISLSYLYSLFNDDHATVAQFVHAKRLQRAYELLAADQKGHRTISEVAYNVGFKNVSHFSRSFSRRFGVSPREMRQSGRPNGAVAQHGRPKGGATLDAFIAEGVSSPARHDAI
jgi:AraC-like DNA-binding protein